MNEHEAQMTQWLNIIQGEYREMPGLQLTKPQVRRLWGLDDPTCEAVLDALSAAHVLRLSRAGRYMLVDGAAVDES
jgi:hypothetical protein